MIAEKGIVDVVFETYISSHNGNEPEGLYLNPISTGGGTMCPPVGFLLITFDSNVV